ncbi:FOG protein containing GGDEF domain [Gracilibacillus boraciitolerans JCM 21714]|uniref:FOG protein containing GGDEF domain n=1 Tax=Gracilibacillus boraciitolerans JCM 21714 TaxID=1298598 RepID=W4VMI0_9BACI|nr:GGDEF domain-containing protein [Gracilibacillus boraciitolerans]GAE94610.1 FOG protein containing GGDEF domain [Gracilibacillus boraciitolerans JCM 21714]
MSRQAVLDRLDEGIVLIDPLGKIVEVNHVSIEIFHRLFQVENYLVEVIDQHVNQFFREVQPLIDAIENNQMTKLSYHRANMYYDIHVTRLGNRLDDLFLVVWKDVTDKTLYEKRLQEMAIKDPLTKLSNRRAFIDKYNKRDKDAEYTFLLLDIDYFKHFNDRYGHFIGDKVLQQVADLIRQHFPRKRCRSNTTWWRRIRRFY